MRRLAGWTFALGTVLDVGGAFRLSGIAVTSDAAELNKLDGTGPTVTAANLTDLTDGGPADPLHTHASVANAGTLVPEGEDVARAIRNGRTMAFGRCSMPLFHVFTTALLMERRVVKPKKSR